MLNLNFPLVGSYGVAVENISKGKTGMVSFMGLAYRCFAVEDILKYQQVILLSKEESYFKIKLSLDESKKVSVDGLKLKMDDLYDDIVKEGTRTKESTLSTLKTDVKDMKAVMGDVKGMTIFSVLEVKGGNVDVNEYSDDVCKSLTTTLTKLAEFNIGTPSPPTGLTVYKYALMINVQCRYQSTVSGYYLKIYIDGEDKFTIPITGTLTWFDRALDVNVGTHTVQIWSYNLVGNCPDYGVKSIKASCGMGTVGTSDTLIAETTETCGEAKSVLAVAGKSYGENTTIVGSSRIDDSPVERKDVSGDVTKGGTEYTYSGIHEGMISSHTFYYGRTGSENVPLYYKNSRTTIRRSAR